MQLLYQTDVKMLSSTFIHIANKKALKKLTKVCTQDAQFQSNVHVPIAMSQSAKAINQPACNIST